MIRRNVLFYWLFILLLICTRSSFAEVNKSGILYTNDLGSATLDVSSYPVVFQKIYKGALQKCTKCHSLARPLNSEFLELNKKEIDDLRRRKPEIFKETSVLKIEVDIWKRYVKRMMAKPGCDIKSKDGKAIWQFLVYDSKKRKTGKNMKKWQEYRHKLLNEFKAEFPERYKELYVVSE